MRKLTFFLLLLVVPFAGQSTGNADDSTFRIGVIAPLTGTSAAYGRYIKNGIDLAYGQLPAETQSKVQIIYEDDGWNVSKSLSAFKKLSTINKIDSVIVVGSAVGNAVAPLAEMRGMPLISVGASDHRVSQDRSFAFIHWVTPETEAKKMVSELKRRNYSRLAIIGTEHDGVIAMIDSLQVQFNKAGLSDRLILQETYLNSESDFRTYIAKARRAQVDGVIVCLFPGSLAAFAKQTRELGLNVDLIGIELFEDENEVQAADGALLGQWYVNADSASDEFEKEYRAKYHEHPGWAAANGFDSLNLLVNAYNKSGGVGKEIASFLDNLTDYRGAAGVYSATGDNRFTLPAAIKVVTEDGFEKVRG